MNQQMDEEVARCRDSIAEILEAQAAWRGRKAADWPDDVRNARSAEALGDAATFVRTMDPEHPCIRQFAEWSWALRREGMTDWAVRRDAMTDGETISGTYAAGRFFFDKNRGRPGSSDFERLLDAMYLETLETWWAREGGDGDGLPPLLLEHLQAHGIGWPDEDDDDV